MCLKKLQAADQFNIKINHWFQREDTLTNAF